MNWFEVTIISLCVILVLLPPKYDPVIRFKEWIEKDKPKGKDYE